MHVAPHTDFKLDSNQRTDLHLAVENSSAAEVERLVKKYEDFPVIFAMRDRWSYTAMEWAQWYAHQYSQDFDRQRIVEVFNNAIGA